MTKDKALITGGTGLLGHAIVDHFKDCFDVHATYLNNYIPLNNCKLIKLDLRDAKATINSIKDIKPNLIVHTAALTNVDYCEQHPEEAYDSNVNATSNIIKASKNIGCDLIHISTDFVFDGLRGNYKEADTPNPINAYAKTKLQAEKVVQNSKINYLIIRTTIYGWNLQDKQCVTEKAISDLRNNMHIKACTDWLSTPIIVTHLARLIGLLYLKKAIGIFHIGCDKKMSRYDIAIKIAEEFSLDKKLIIPVSSKDIVRIAPRPSDVSLNNSKVKSLLKLKEISIEKDINELKSTEQYVKDRKENPYH